MFLRNCSNIRHEIHMTKVKTIFIAFNWYTSVRIFYYFGSIHKKCTKVCKLIWCSSCRRLFHTLVEIMFSRITFYHTHWERIQATWLNRVFTSSWLYFVACLFLGSWLFQETFRMKQKVFVTTRVFGAVFIWNMAYLK